MSQKLPDIFKTFSIRRIIWPVLLGLFFTFGYMLYSDYTGDGAIRNGLKAVNWSGYVFMWLGFGVLTMLIRDLGYVWRIRVLSDKKLSWKASIQVVMLWEFTSAVSPSIVGGSAVAILLFIQEKINAGKSTALTFITIFLDEVFFVLILPVALLLVGYDSIFFAVENEAVGQGVELGFWIAYSVAFVYTLFLAWAIFIHPVGTHGFIKRLFTWRLFRRWQSFGFKMADDLKVAALEYRQKTWKYWLSAWSATVLSWMGRYLVLNCVLAAFAIGVLGFQDHLIAFARQAIMFVMMILSPTPGSAGLAEILFSRVFSDLIPIGLPIALAFIWRLISYYPYLFIGPILFPNWLKRVSKKGSEIKNEETAKEEESSPIEETRIGENV